MAKRRKCACALKAEGTDIGESILLTCADCNRREDTFEIDVPLAGLMIDHGVGTSTAAIYEIKKVDQEYFVEE